MNKYMIEVDGELDTALLKLSHNRNKPVEVIIGEILSRFLLPLHTMDSEEMGKAYTEMGEINLDIANL